MSGIFSGFRSILVLGLGLGLFVTGGGLARVPQANGSAARVDVETAGPKVGDGLPDFSLQDQHGDVRSLKSVLFFEEAYQERDTVSSILVRLGQHVDVHATKLTGAHVTVTSYATDQIAAPGTHFSLVVEAAPRARVHVYAPGASGYKPVTLTLRPQPGVVVKAAQFPRPEDYFFRPLNEHVPVYQHPFRIVQDVMLDPSTEGTAALKDVTTPTIAGTFEYQACDDKVCFLPQFVPLSWTIGVKPLDRERAKHP